MNASPFGDRDTLPKQFLDLTRRFGEDRVAVRQKEMGIWQEFTWTDSLNVVRDLALGLVELGLERGQRVCIIGDNDRQYLWADLAIMAVGGVTVGIFTDSIPTEMEYIINHSEAVIAFAKDQEQCDKFIELREKIPGIKKVIYWDGKGMWHYDDSWLISLDDLLKLGQERHAQNPGLFDELVEAGKGEDYCNFCYTSGTTGLPKGAMLTHLNFMHATESNQSFEPRFPEDNMLSFAPLAWIAEHTLNVAPHCMLGIVINFPESPETVQQDIREIAPDVLFFPARLWENLTAMIQVGINDSTWVNRAIYKFFLPIGYKVADLKYENKPIPLPLALAHFIGDRIVFLPLRSQLGMHRVRTALTAGASLSPDMLRYFRAIGLNLKQVFATTETTAVGTQHWENDVNFASVGKPIPGVEVEIAEDGEIVMGGENIFHGYFKNDEATLSSLRVDETGRRWFMTGDAGYLDPNGHVIYLDRKKDLIQLAHGDRFSPQFIEGRLKFSPYIRDVMTVGHEAVEYVTALIAIDFDNVGRWAEKQSIPYTTFIDLAQKPEVYNLILADVRRVNETLPPTGQVKRFLLLHKDFDADEAEMTRTRKLRRRFLTERYSDLIRAMYDGKDSVAIRAEIVYQDGRSSVIETEVRIMSAVEEGVPV